MDHSLLFLYVLGANIAFEYNKCRGNQTDIFFVIVSGTVCILCQSIHDFIASPWNIQKIKTWIRELILIIFYSNLVNMYVGDPPEFIYLFYIYLFHNILFATASVVIRFFFVVTIVAYMISMGPFVSIFPYPSQCATKAHFHIFNFLFYLVIVPLSRIVLAWILDLT